MQRLYPVPTCEDIQAVRALDLETFYKRNQQYPEIAIVPRVWNSFRSADPPVGAVAVTGYLKQFNKNETLPKKEVWRWEVPKPWQNLTMFPADDRWVPSHFKFETAKSPWLPVGLIGTIPEDKSLQRLAYFEATTGFQWEIDLTKLPGGDTHIFREVECTPDGNTIVLGMISKEDIRNANSTSQILVLNRSGQCVRHYILEGIRVDEVSRSLAGGYFKVIFRVEYLDGKPAPIYGSAVYLLFDRSGTMLGAVTDDKGALSGEGEFTRDDTQLVAPTSGLVYMLPRR